LEDINIEKIQKKAKNLDYKEILKKPLKRGNSQNPLELELLLNKNNYQVVASLGKGSMGGLEIVTGVTNFKYSLISNSSFTSVYKINLKALDEHLKEFMVNLLPLFIELEDKIHTQIDSIKYIDYNIIPYNCQKYKKNNNKNICFNKDEKLNKIIIDILFVKNIFLDDILERNIDQYNLMWSVYKIIRVLLLFRSDIVYNIIFVEIIYLFSIVEEREEIAFSNIVNFLFNNNFIKLLIGNEKFRKDMTNKNIYFFKNLIKSKIPNVDEHLSHLEIIPELYFIPWMDELYIKVLNINILLQVFDLYLLNGEYILFQTGVAILKILEDEITNMTISQVLNSLKRLPDKYKKERFFEVFYNLNGIKSDYVEWNRQNELMRHKNILLNE
jgi:hypothetical protein